MADPPTDHRKPTQVIEQAGGDGSQAVSSRAGRITEPTKRGQNDVLVFGENRFSRLESREDLRLSTLNKYIDAIGGRLHLIVEFPEQDPVVLTGISRGRPKAKKGTE